MTLPHALHIDSGSYAKNQVQFVLRKGDLQECDPRDRTAVLAAGEQHFSEVPSKEPAPSPLHIDIFRSVTRSHSVKMARDIMELASQLAASAGQEIVLVSLMRAGTPVGVLLQCALDHLGVTAHHYSVTMILERGMDFSALQWIAEQHPDIQPVFVDGWTGKGAVSALLKHSICQFNEQAGLNWTPRLAVIQDIAGIADFHVGGDEYLIPSALLGATVSGLFGRPFIRKQNPELHFSILQNHLGSLDQSRWFIQSIERRFQKEAATSRPARPASIHHKAQSTLISDFVSQLLLDYKLDSSHYIKLGLTEVCRAILRRPPAHLFVRDLDEPDIKPFLALANIAKIQIDKMHDLPVKAMAITQPRALRKT